MDSRKRRNIDESTCLLEDHPECSSQIRHRHEDNTAGGFAFLKLRYPKSVFFIISNEFCERFTYYGIRSVLSLYLISSLNYDTNTATILYHLFTMLLYFAPLFGAILADSFLGKYKTIVYLSLIYALGSVILSVASIAVIPLPHREISLLGLLFIAIGTGGIKPCVSSLGGDQFVLPEQALLLQKFFSFFYFAINSGSMISTFITPTFRNDVKCFSQQSCFPLAFGVPAVLMIVSIVIFVAGRRLYKVKTPDENVIVIFFACVWRGLSNKFRGVNNGNKEHWLEYADDKFSKQKIEDVRAVWNVLVLFTPLPIFWALYDQQGSRWTFQATNMDGRIFGFTIKPDQMQVLNPLLILAFIPIFEVFIYPILKTVGIKRPLQKLVLGAILAAVSFGCSSLVEFQVEKSYAPTPVEGTSNLRIFNSLNCSIALNPPVENHTMIEPLSAITIFKIPVGETKSFEVQLQVVNSCPLQLKGLSKDIKISNGIDTSYFVSEEAGSLWLSQPTLDKLTKDEDGAVKLRFFYGSSNNQPINVKVKSVEDQNTILSQDIQQNTVSDIQQLQPGKYDISVDEDKPILAGIDFNPGEIDTIIIQGSSKSGTTQHATVFNLAPANKVHMLWQLPQIMIISAGEVMFTITGLEFSFTQAPNSMKSVLSAVWLLTIAFGNLVVVIISELKFFESQAYEFLLFTALMVIDVFIIIVLCVRYKYVTYNNDSEASIDSPSEHTKDITSSTSRVTSLSSVNDNSS